MKKSNFLAILSVFTVLCACSCSPTTSSSSSSEFSYEPLDSSSVQGYVFDLNGKYVLDNSLSVALNAIKDSSDTPINKLKTLENIVDVNDFCVNKTTTTTKKIDHYGMVEGNTSLGESNYEYDLNLTKVRNNNNHTLSGSSVETSKTIDGTTNVNGSYSLTYDEGYFYALEKWDYDTKDDVNKTHLLCDEFVDTYLCLVNSKNIYDYILTQQADTTFFSISNISGSALGDEIEFHLYRERYFENEEMIHTQFISITFSLEGYISKTENKYCVYNGSKNENNIYYLDSVEQTFEII